MNSELQQKLWDAYPTIFRLRGEGPMRSNMCFGCECGDGWYALLDDLCAALLKVCPDIYATQVKEKYGTLRFYTANSNDEAEELIRIAEGRSGKTCETCGKPGTGRCDAGWYSTLCDECVAKRG